MFRFLNLTASLMTDEIIAHISDMVIILDTDLKIFMVNDKYTEILNPKGNNIINESIYKIVSDKDEAEAKFDELLRSGERSLRCRLNFHEESENVLTDSYISKIYDRFNDHTGFLIISRENKGKLQFQKMFNITKREFEIIDLVLSGAPNVMIAEKLKISRRTVETHRQHVYSKLGINDRIDLFHLAMEFNIIPGK